MVKLTNNDEQRGILSGERWDSGWRRRSGRNKHAGAERRNNIPFQTPTLQNLTVDARGHAAAAGRAVAGVGAQGISSGGTTVEVAVLIGGGGGDQTGTGDTARR